MEFRKLRAEEIECRVGNVHSRGFTLLLYKDARVDMTILDETVGPTNWQRDHKEIKGTVYCGVGIQAVPEEYEGSYEWVWKWDAGAESYTEKEKGEASDSFKRACVNWGIGRELYTAPFISINAKTERDGKGYKLVRKGDGYGFKVSVIEYDGDRISYLEIEKDGEIVWAMQQKYITEREFRNLTDLCKKHEKDLAWLLATAGAASGREITKEGYAKVVKALDN